MADSTLPNDFPRPNTTDDSRVPAKNGVADIEPADPTNTLLPDSVAFDVTANTWTAVTLNPGLYTVKGRDDGQVVYVAPAADAKSALRITKQFDIETQQRAVLYIKGQTALDAAMVRIEGALAGKADIDSVYNKEQTKQLIDMLIAASLAGLTNIMTFKGVVDTVDDLPSDDVEVGDVYQVLADGGFYTIKEDTQPYQWERLSGSIIDISEYYTKSEVDLMLSDKASNQEVAELRGVIEGFIPPFTYEQGTDPALDGIDGADPTKAGDTWFDTEKGLIFIRKESQVDGTLQWFNGLDSYFVLKSNEFVKLTGKQTISGEKLFSSYPKMDSDVQPTNGREFITLDYFNANKGTVGGGGSIDTDAFARLDEVNTFTNNNYYDFQPIINNPQEVDDVSYYQLLTKSQAIALLDLKFQENPSILSPLPLASLTNDSLITKSDLVAYVAANGGVSNGSGNGNATPIDLTDYARLSEDNIFNGINTFNNGARSLKDPASDSDLVPLLYLTNAIAANNAQYTTTTALQLLLQDYVLKADLTAVMTYKGSVMFVVDLASKQKEVGDVWYVQQPKEEAGFVVWNGNAWDSLGTSAVSVDMSDLAKLHSDNTFTRTNTFLLNYKDTNGNTQHGAFEVEGMLSIDNDNILMNQSKFQLDSTGASFLQPLHINIGNSKQIASFTNDYILLYSNPQLIKEKDYIDIRDNDLITKYQAKKIFQELAPNLGGGGSTTPIDTSDFAKLSANNVFAGINDFQRLPTLSMNPTSENQAVRKAYVDSAVSTKANANDVYGKTQIDALLQQYALKSDITSIMEFKGNVADFNYLPAVPTIGDVYNVLAATSTKDAGFYVFTASGWQMLGGSAVTIDTSDLAKLKEPNVFTGANSFATNPIVSIPNAANANALITKSEAEAITTGFLKASDNITFTGNVSFAASANFAQTPKIDSEDIATKKYVDEQLAAYVPSGGGTGGDIDTSNLATLNGNNIFIGTNEFATNPQIATPKELGALNDNDIVTKHNLYIVDDNGDKKSLFEVLNELREYESNLPIVSTTIPNTGAPNKVGRLWIKTSYLKEGEKLLQKPALYVCVYTIDTASVWYDVHKEELIGG